MISSISSRPCRHWAGWTVAIFAVAISTSPLGAQVFPEVGPNDFLISEATNPSLIGSFLPEMAYNPDLDQVLVIWRVRYDSGYEIKGQYLASSGGPIGPPFFIADMPVLVTNPIVAYDTNNARYLVVWTGQVGGGLDGVFLNQDGSVWGPYDLTTPCHNVQFVHPCVASLVFNPTDSEYLLVWIDLTNNDTTGSVVRGRRIGSGAELLGDEFFLASSTNLGGRKAPGLAYNPLTNEYLIAWSKYNAQNVSRIVTERRQGGTGDHVGVSLVISDDNGVGAERQAFNPRVAYNSLDNEYLVVWEGERSPPLATDEQEIFGQRLLATGFETGVNDFRISAAGSEGDPSFEARHPRLAFNPAAGRYLVVWSGDSQGGGLNNNENEIFGRYLDRAGTPLPPLEFRISDMGNTGNANFDAENPALAWMGAPGEFLAIWNGDDALDNFNEVFGQRLDGLGLVLFVDGFESGDVARWSSSSL
ncbi:MAG: hypothetical protein K8J08_14455 [Thermoanaerobaculia bacterium]|nr:hypothetical protein [Thermoanaerobaculia bacterium]